jgi:hypothetical protein
MLHLDRTEMKHIHLILFCIIILYSCKGFNQNENLDVTEKNMEASTLNYSLEVIKYEPNEELDYCRKNVFKIKQNNQYLDSIETKIEYGCCQVENKITLFDNSFEIKDLNNDSHKEISFVYMSMCRGDVSSDNLKAVLYDTHEKKIHTIDGYTLNEAFRQSESDTTGTIKKISSNIPKSFLSYLKKHWYSYSFSEKTPEHNSKNEIQVIKLKEKIKIGKAKTPNLERNIKKAVLSSPNIEITLLDGKVLNYNEPVFYTDEYDINVIDNHSIELMNRDSRSDTKIKSFWYFDAKKETLILYKIEGSFLLENSKKTCVLNNINYDIKNVNPDSVIETLKENGDCIEKQF